MVLSAHVQPDPNFAGMLKADLLTNMSSIRQACPSIIGKLAAMMADHKAQPFALSMSVGSDLRSSAIFELLAQKNCCIKSSWHEDSHGADLNVEQSALPYRPPSLETCLHAGWKPGCELKASKCGLVGRKGSCLLVQKA